MDSSAATKTETPYIIGLTGGIGSGKTTVSNEFAALGIDVIDADVVSHTVTAHGQPALTKITEHFGSAALLDDGNLNRAWMRQRVFQNPDDKQWLEALLHPLIGDAILHALSQSTSTYTLFVSPLLLKSSLKSMCQRIAIVDIPREEQVTRTQARDNSSTDTINAIINAQTSRDERLQQADDVIDNSADLAHLLEQVHVLHKQYLELAQSLTPQ